MRGGVERYQFTWPDKKKSVVLANQPINKTLRLDREKSVGKDGGFGSIDTENIYIEGDNFEALKLLQETYLGKVKLIYIDPPYNTGNDFIYEDDFSQDKNFYKANSGQTDDEGNRLVQNTESNGRFHTDWLNMIYPRLKIAKDILSDDGIIFISIDDSEYINLRQICNDIFGARNYVETFINRSNPRGNQAKKFTASEHEYILCFAKNKNLIKPLGFVKEESDFIEEDTNGKYSLTGLRKRGAGARREDAPNEFFPIYYNPETNEIALERKSNYVEIIPKLANGDDGRWRWSREKVLRDTNLLEVRQVNRRGTSKLEYDIFVKKYFNGVDITKVKSIFYEKDVNNENATEELQELFDSKIFDYPKPVYTLKKLVSLLGDNNLYILDFFSGSATTAHAVMELNAEDCGCRKFILVQYAEMCNEASEAYKNGYKTICDIGEERIRRAGKKIREEHPDADIDIGFRVFKVDSSNMKDVYYKPDAYEQGQIDLFTDNIKEDRTPEDLLFQVMLDLGISLSSKIEESVINDKKVFVVGGEYTTLDVINDKKVFVVGGEYTTLDGSSRTHLIACFDKDITDDTVKAIAKKHPSYAVFRDSCMANDSVATNFEQIFETYSPDTVRKVL